MTQPLSDIIAELRRLIERPDSSLYPGYGKPRVDYVSARNLAEIVDRLEAGAGAIEVANHTLEVVVRSKMARIKRVGQLCKRFNADLEEVCEKLRVARQDVEELGQSRDRWLELAQWAANRYQALKAQADHTEAELEHVLKVSQARADCIGAYADAINAQAEEIFELKQKVEDLQLHPDRPSAAPRKPTLIQRLRRLFHA